MKKIFSFCILLAAFGLFVYAGCEKAQVGGPGETPTQGGQTREAGSAQATQPPAALAPSTGTVATIVLNTSNGQVSFSAEIAQTDEERARGLQNRESLAENTGMWFIFPQMVHEQFWMRDTKIPLDLIYVDDNMRVVHIVDNAPAESTDPTQASSPVPFKYVLEVGGGSTGRLGIRVGDSVQQRIGPQ